jgi:hypothetical protein
MCNQKKLWEYLRNGEWDKFYDPYGFYGFSSAQTRVLKQLARLGAAGWLFEIITRAPTFELQVRILILVIQQRPNLTLMRTLLNGATLVPTHHTQQHVLQELVNEIRMSNDVPLICDIWNRYLQFSISQPWNKAGTLLRILIPRIQNPPSQLLELFIQSNLAWILIDSLPKFVGNKKIGMDIWIPFCEQIQKKHIRHRLKRNLRKIHEEIRIYHLKIKKWMAPIPIHLVDEILSYFHIPK